MHEVSLCENMLEILKDQAQQEQFAKVTRVHVDVGPFSCVEPEALRFGFDAVMKDTLADGAVLQISRPAGEALCLACFRTVPVATRFDPCSACGSDALQVVRGDELKIREVEVL